MTGCGIAQDIIPTLFDPFSNTRLSMAHASGGVGLGLSIVKRVTEVLGGSLALDSKVGVGSTFTVQVPVYMMTEAEAAACQSAAAERVVPLSASPQPPPPQHHSIEMTPLTSAGANSSLHVPASADPDTSPTSMSVKRNEALHFTLNARSRLALLVSRTDPPAPPAKISPPSALQAPATTSTTGTASVSTSHSMGMGDPLHTAMQTTPVLLPASRVSPTVLASADAGHFTAAVTTALNRAAAAVSASAAAAGNGGAAVRPLRMPDPLDSASALPTFPPSASTSASAGQPSAPAARGELMDVLSPLLHAPNAVPGSPAYPIVLLAGQ
jgi:hypothetical protein